VSTLLLAKQRLGSSAADEHGSVADTRALVRAAAEDCLRQSPYDRRDIDVLINVGVYRSGFLAEPAVAAMAAGDLAINDGHNPQDPRKTLAFDIFNGSVGFLNACYAAAGMIHAGRARRVMIVASEVENNVEAGVPERRGVRQLGSAAIVDRSDGRTGFGRFLFRYATQYVDSFTSCAAQEGGRTYLALKRSANLENYYLQIIDQSVRELLDAEGLALPQIRAIFPPQISAAFVSRLAALLQAGKDRVVSIADDRGDWFTSSSVCALKYAHEQKMVAPGDVGLLINVGTGIQVGCALYHF
jgi:3-oxoacyl-[acyl-carrier-protein] synthase III